MVVYWILTLCCCRWILMFWRIMFLPSTGLRDFVQVCHCIIRLGSNPVKIWQSAVWTVSAMKTWEHSSVFPNSVLVHTLNFLKTRIIFLTKHILLCVNSKDSRFYSKHNMYFLHLNGDMFWIEQSIKGLLQDLVVGYMQLHAEHTVYCCVFVGSHIMWMSVQ
jgi:hypothetical protein